MDLVSNVIALAKLHVREEELHLKLDLIDKENQRLYEEDQQILRKSFNIPNCSSRAQKYVPAALKPECSSNTNQIEENLAKQRRRLKIKAKLEKRKEKETRKQKLSEEIAIWEKKKSDNNLIKSQILQDLTNEFPGSKLKMALEITRVSNKCLFKPADVRTAKVDEKLKQEELDYYRSLPPPPPPSGFPGKHLKQPVEKNPQKDVFRYFHYNQILESYEITDSRIPPKHLRK